MTPDVVGSHDSGRTPTVAAAQPPWAISPGLRRDRLLALLDRPARLSLVVAPAGHGKTTLLAQHATGRGGPLAWHRAVPEDSEPGHLLASLHHALVRAGRPLARPRDLDALLHDLDAHSTEPLTIVLDDAHLLLDSPGEAQLERLLTDGPRTLRMLMGSRRAPGLNLCRAELGPVVTLGTDDLRFRSWEVEDLFRDVYQEPLPPDDIAALTRRTDGWAACLQLFHLSTQFRPLLERRRAVATLAGGSRFARSFLARTVLDELPAELTEFLTRTAVFEVLTPLRCDQLLARTGSGEHLERLEELGVLTASDDDGRAYRCHEVLRRHLESALREQEGTVATNRWYARAAGTLEAEGASGEAVRTCLRGEQWERATQLLQRAGRRAIDGDPGAPWDDVLSPELVDEDPWLSTALARKLAADGRLPAAARRYRRAESLFPDPVDAERTARERRLVELWTAGRPQPHLHWLDRVRAAVTRRPDAQTGRPTTGPGPDLAGALAALLTGDVATAGRALQSVLGGDGDDPVGSRTAPAGLLPLAARLAHAFVALTGGASIEAEVDRIAADADRLGAGWFVRQARVLRGLDTGDGTEITRVEHECRVAGDVWGELLAAGAAAYSGLAAGRPSTSAFAELTRRCAELDAGSLRAWALAGEALSASLRREPAASAVLRAAEAAGRSTGVWGIQALTALAAAGTATDPGDALTRARELARATGLPWPESLAGRLLTASRPTPAEPAPAGVTVREIGHLPVQLRCLGGFRLDVAGRPVEWAAVRPRAASAFRLLAVHAPDAVHRETLLQLWPGLPGGQAMHSLQVAVSSLRSLLAPDAPRGSARMVERRGESYLLVLPPGSTADVRAFREDVRLGDRARLVGDAGEEAAALARAVAGYGGDLLPEDGAAEWVVPERDRLRLRAATACARLAELRLAAGELGEGAAAARRGVEIDPYADAAWRMLIRACDRLGDSAAAARARRDYTGMLRSLGIPAPRALRPTAG